MSSLCYIAYSKPNIRPTIPIILIQKH